MVFEIILPVFLFLGDLDTIIQQYKQQKYFVVFDDFINDVEKKEIEKRLEVKSLIARIRELLFTDQSNLAMKYIEELSVYPEASSYYLFYLATHETKSENYIKAKSYLEQSLSKNADFDPAWNLLGYIESLRENYKGALEAYKKANTLNPYQPVYCYNLAKTYYMNGDYGNAGKEIDRCIGLKDNFGEFFYLKGLILEKMDNLEGALEAFNLAMEKLYLDENFLHHFLKLSYRREKTEYIERIIEKTDRLLHQDINRCRFVIFVNYGEWDKAFPEFLKLTLNFYKNEEEGRDFFTGEEVKKLLCSKKRNDVVRFLNLNKERLEPYKQKLLQDMLKESCPATRPLVPRDPLVKPAF